MDEDRHQVWRGGDEVELSPTEFRLLRYFLLNPERVLSKQQILDHVWQYDFNGEDNVVETYVSYLRRKLDVAEPRLLRTVRGFGYVLRADGRDRATVDADRGPRAGRSQRRSRLIPMSLRARLLISLAVMLSVALLAAGVAARRARRAPASSTASTTSSWASRAGRRAPAARQPRPPPTATPAGASRSCASTARATSSAPIPSGFATDPDPLPSLPVYAGGHPGRRLRPHRGAPGRRRLPQLPRPDPAGRGRNITLAIAAPLAGVDAAVAALIRTLLLTGSIALVGLLVVAWFVVRHDLLPLERIARTAESIAGGDLSHRAGVPHDGTEVGRLGTAFDAMLDQIETSFGEQQAALEAKAASEERLRRFVADASHELRTPLTAVRGYADLYRAGGLADPDELATAMARIGTESRRMGALVDDLLLLARLDQGRPVRHDPRRPVADRERRRRRCARARARTADHGLDRRRASPWRATRTACAR